MSEMFLRIGEITSVSVPTFREIIVSFQAQKADVKTQDGAPPPCVCVCV